MENNRVYKMSFGSVYPHYINKVEKKGRTKQELDDVILWLTGYKKEGFLSQIKNECSLEDFFGQAPKMNPLRANIKGVICGVRIEDIKEPLMKEIRYMDKLVDDLAKGKPLDKILQK